jgi:hypothetical protein
MIAILCASQRDGRAYAYEHRLDGALNVTPLGVRAVRGRIITDMHETPSFARLPEHLKEQVRADAMPALAAGKARA